MAKFAILRSNPVELKTSILEFWSKYLPGTSPERLLWLQSNPEGPTEWLFAFDDDNKELAGIVSIMRHDLFVNGSVTHAGVIGDFMVSDKYRVFGPALQLQKAVIEARRDLKLDLLYTVPNSSSLRLVERVGYIEKIKMCHMIRPLKTGPYIFANWKNKNLTKISSNVLDNIIKLWPSKTSITNTDRFQLVDNVDDSFELFWEKIKTSPNAFLGNRSAEYLKWRYGNNPEACFLFLKYENSDTNELLGYIVYSTHEHKISIYDLVAVSDMYIEKLLKKLLQIAYSRNYQAIYIRVPKSSPLINKLKRFIFIDAKDDISVLVFDDASCIDYDSWYFLENDRNI